MALSIVRSDEPIVIEHVRVLIYAPSGVGKTTLANSAESPITLAFDPGIYRASNRKDAIIIKSWQEAIDFVEAGDEIKEYKTIIIDTVGRALESLIDFLAANDPKIRKSDGNPTQNGYGAIKIAFSNFLKRINNLGKDVILIAHDKEDKNGETIIVRPDIIGSSYNTIQKDLDLCGYMYMDANKRYIDFDPSGKSIGKNSAQFPVIEVFNIIEDAGKEDAVDMRWIISKTKEALNNLTEDQKKAVEWIESFKTLIADSKEPKDFDILAEQIKNPEITETIKKQVRSLMIDKTKELNIEFSTEKGKFIKIKE